MVVLQPRVLKMSKAKGSAKFRGSGCKDGVGVTMNKIQRDAEADGRSFLAKVLVGDDKIDTVNPISIARSFGIEVYDADLPQGVSGILRKLPQGVPEIYVQRTDATSRKRFTVAHELGHMVLRQKSGDYEADNITRVDKRDDLASRGTNSDEMYANAFAAAILMPQTTLESMIDSGYNDRQIAASLGVSQAALANRFDNLGLVH